MPDLFVHSVGASAAESALTIKAVDRIDAPDGPLLLECSLFPQTEQRRLRRLVHRFFILFYF
jgi:hypothetical protein